MNNTVVLCDGCSRQGTQAEALAWFRVLEPLDDSGPRSARLLCSAACLANYAADRLNEATAALTALKAEAQAEQEPRAVVILPTEEVREWLPWRKRPRHDGHS